MNYKIGKGKPPKSTQFKKGLSGNPSGAKKHNQDIKKIKHLLRSDVVYKLIPLFHGTISDLNDILRNKESSILELAFASVLLRSIKKGDWKAFKGIVDFIVGKEENNRYRKEVFPERTYIVKKVLL